MSFLSRLAGPHGKTSVKKGLGGIFRSRLFQSIVAPHTMIRNVINRKKPMSAKEQFTSLFGF